MVSRPQANGQVEVVKKTIKHNLKMKLEDLKGRWADELPEVLWAYRTTIRSTTRETLFSLAYGYEAMVPVEIGAGFLRRDNYDPEQNLILQRYELKNDIIHSFESQHISNERLGTSTLR